MKQIYPFAKLRKSFVWIILMSLLMSSISFNNVIYTQDKYQGKEVTNEVTIKDFSLKK